MPNLEEPHHVTAANHAKRHGAQLLRGVARVDMVLKTVEAVMWPPVFPSYVSAAAKHIVYGVLFIWKDGNSHDDCGPAPVIIPSLSSLPPIPFTPPTCSLCCPSVSRLALPLLPVTN